MNDYIIRTMGREELAIAFELAAAEGWNPGLHDADSFYATDPNGFFAGLLGGQPIATISAVKYSPDFAFIGLYIVKPGYRGKGYGLRLWNAALDYLEGCNIGLDGVVERQEAYKKSGFHLAYRNIRYEGAGGGEPPSDANIVELAEMPLEDLYAYDRPLFPAERRQFTAPWIGQPESSALGILRTGRLAGYGVLRRCRSGYKIGPLFADAPEPAESLFLALRSRAAPGSPIYLDIPEVNPAAVALVQRHGLTRVFETARMYTGENPELPLDRIFGVTTFELG
jgi:ribosomal protein S18 acetylase RimI-like enzyme